MAGRIPKPSLGRSLERWGIHRLPLSLQGHCVLQHRKQLGFPIRARPSATWTWADYGPSFTNCAFPPCILARYPPPTVSLCRISDCRALPYVVFSVQRHAHQCHYVITIIIIIISGSPVLYLPPHSRSLTHPPTHPLGAAAAPAHSRSRFSAPNDSRGGGGERTAAPALPPHLPDPALSLSVIHCSRSGINSPVPYSFLLPSPSRLRIMPGGTTYHKTIF